MSQPGYGKSDGPADYSMEEFEKSYEGQDIPCPENWVGYHILPEEFEFWFGREGRLHERCVYQKSGGIWRTLLKSP